MDNSTTPSIIKCSIYMTWQWEIGCEVLARDDPGWKLNNLTDRYSWVVSWIIHYSFSVRVVYHIYYSWSLKRAVLFLIPLTWSCYSLFLIFQCYRYSRFWPYLFNLCGIYFTAWQISTTIKPPSQWVIVNYTFSGLVSFLSAPEKTFLHI